MISIYADGSSRGRIAGEGGYGFVVVRDETEVLAWGYGGSPNTTNNLMEMHGAICGLEAVLELGLEKGSEPRELVSDSKYTLGMASGGYNPTKNFETVSKLLELAKAVGCRFRWVPGHQGNTYNELCDQLAKQGKTENAPKKDPL